MCNGFWIQCGTALTDEYGYYKVSGLPTGIYGLSANAVEGDYAVEWYKETGNVNNRIPVWVTSPGDTPNIDFTLDIGGTVSGRVTCLHNGMPAPITNVIVCAINAQTWQWVGDTVTDTAGNYKLGLPTGDYFVRVNPHFSGLLYTPEYYDNTWNITGATTISVTVGEHIQNKDFSLELGGP